MTRRGDALPSGVVTFLLTDIEGSTQAWQAAPAEMTTLVSRHYDLLDEAVSAHGGRRPEEQGEGDSVVAAFTDPRAAVAAAVQAQLVLRRELPALPVRMALHTGHALLRNEDNYVGLTIIRCARIRSAAHGGQILVSDDTATLVAGSLPDRTGLLDLGRYGLKGLTGRERIWQLTHRELPESFPPLSAGASAAGNLPTPMSSFVGRRTELIAVGNSLGVDRLVTLVGETGVGKSRVANAAAQAAGASIPGGVWWVDLSEVRDAEVADVLLRACALHAPGSTDPVDAIASHFRSVARALVVLDGVDRLAGGAADLADRLLGQCPDLHILATGRSPLRLPGELVHEIPPMKVPPESFDGSVADLDRHDASRLFVERARRADGTTACTDDDAAHVARICRRLRGVPLSIELAAARSRTTPIAQLARSLDADGIAWDGAGPDNTSTRSVAWAYESLGDTAQTALRRLGVFRGSFEVDAATAIVTGPPIDPQTAIAAIHRLTDQHLVTYDHDVGRLAMSGTVREFARARLAEAPDDGLASAHHGSWFAAVAERFAAGGTEMPMSLLAPDEADVLHALDAAMAQRDASSAYRIVIALAPRWARSGQSDLVASAADWIVGRAPSDGEELWSAAVARLACARADDTESSVHELAEEARAIAELSGDDVSPMYLDVVAAVRDHRAGDAEPATVLAARARAAGVVDVEGAIHQLTDVGSVRPADTADDANPATGGSVPDDMAAQP